jgi:hypothetical protein
MINIIGYLLMAAAIEEGFSTSNPFGSSETFLGRLYTPTTYGDNTIFVLNATGGQGTVVGSVPTETPTSLIQAGISFVDRIFVMFGFIKTILAVLVFPVALFTYLGLPYQIAMLFIAPLTFLYIIGLFDLLSGGNN